MAIALTAKAFDTLHFLIENRHRIVGKDELLASVWAGRVVEENNLTQAVSALRRAMGAAAGDHRYVVTIPGCGYRFVAEVCEGDPDEAPAGLADPVTAPTSITPVMITSSAWRRTATVVALLFMLMLSAATAWQLRGRTPSPQPQFQPQPALAVLPFRSLSAGPRDELLELGLADTLIARLSRSSALRVLSLAYAQRLAVSQHDALAAGRQLGAAYVIEGSTQREGDRVRVNARLLSVADGATAWAGTFDARIDRVFT